MVVAVQRMRREPSSSRLAAPDLTACCRGELAEPANLLLRLCQLAGEVLGPDLRPAGGRGAGWDKVGWVGDDGERG